MPKRYGGWMTVGLLRFHTLVEEVKTDRSKNCEIVEENYVNHSISNYRRPKKWTRLKIVMSLLSVKI